MYADETIIINTINYSTTETRASFIILVLSCYKKYLDSAMFMLNTLNFAYNLLITLPGIVLFLVGRSYKKRIQVL